MNRWLWVRFTYGSRRLVLAVADHPDGFKIVNQSVAVEGSKNYTRWQAGETDMQALLAGVARKGHCQIRVVDTDDLSDLEALWVEAKPYKVAA